MSSRQFRYAVIHMEGVWQVLMNDRRLGRFSACDEAVEDAVLMARQTAAYGYHTELLVQDAWGRLERHPYSRARSAGAEADGGGLS